MDTREDLGENRNKEESQAANELHPVTLCLCRDILVVLCDIL